MDATAHRYLTRRRKKIFLNDVPPLLFIRASLLAIILELDAASLTSEGLALVRARGATHSLTNLWTVIFLCAAMKRSAIWIDVEECEWKTSISIILICESQFNINSSRFSSDAYTIQYPMDFSHPSFNGSFYFFSLHFRFISFQILVSMCSV